MTQKRNITPPSPHGLLLASGAALLVGFAGCEPDLDSLTAGNQSGLNNGGSAGDNGSGGTGPGASTTGSGGTQSAAGAAGETGATSDTTGSGGTGGPVMPPTHCSDRMRNSGETDEDCGGGECDRCELNARCVVDEDCFSEFCAGSVCRDPSCDDNVQNQKETAIDCGGPCAPDKTCDLGLGCNLDRDCESGACKNKVCVEHCESGKKDDDETDTDCGGSMCNPCPDGDHCKEPEDCESGVCEDTVCIPGTCNDEVTNQDESDMDCGGLCTAESKWCAINAICNSGADCESYVCSSGRCVPDIEILATDMIDNMEDGNPTIMSNDGRAGNWYVFGDSQGTHTFGPTVLAPKRGPSSSIAIHYTGSGFTEWGSGVGFDLNNTGGGASTKQPYDLSDFRGITFWARATTLFQIVISVPDVNTDPAGQLCTDCDHHWYGGVTIDAEWKRYFLDFADLQLESGTVPTPTEFATDAVIGFQFKAPIGSTFDFWIDDVALVREEDVEE